MSCIIYSKVRTIQNNVWSKIKTNNTSKKDITEYNLNDLIDDANHILQKGFGTLIKFEKKIFVITCLHIIGQVNMEINGYMPNKKNILSKIPLKIIKRIPEFDIAVLEFVNKYSDDEFQYYTKHDFHKANQNNGLNNAKLSIMTVDGISNNAIYNESKIMNITMETNNLKYIIVPKIPLIKFTTDIEEIPEFSHDIDGLSGSNIILNKHLVAMVTSYNNMKLEAIPIHFIYDIITSVLKTKTDTLTGFYFCTKVVELEMDNNLVCYGHYITDPKDIGYQTNTSKKFKFKQGDVILSVNNKQFTRVGMITDDNNNYDLPLDTYLMLCCYKGLVNFHIYREQTKKELTQTIYGKSFNDVYDINIFNNNHYIYWKGFIFTELSEELIYEINSSGVKLLGKYFENRKIIKNYKTKLVVLLDIDYKALDQETSDELQKIGLPYKPYENGYTLLVLEKINNKKITTIADLLTILEKSDTKVICDYLAEDNEKSLRLTVN